MMETDRADLVVWRFLDGKAGHESQSLGLVNALSQLAAIEVYDFSVGSRREAFVQLLFKTFRPRANLPTPDYLIGAGHATHWSLLAARRSFGGQAIVLMRPSVPLSFFDYCVIPEHDEPPQAENVVVTRGVLNSIQPSADPDPKRGLILIGGASRHYSWDTRAVRAQLVELLHSKPEMQWVLTTSRRTPAHFLETLQEVQSGALQIVPCEQTPAGWVATQLDLCGEVWVTPDSVSMLFESLSAGARVGLFTLPKSSKPTRVSRTVDRLLSEGRLLRLGEETDRRNDLAPLREADRVARIILSRRP